MRTPLTRDLKSNIESCRRLQMTPLQICHRLELDVCDDLAMVAQVCRQMPKHLGVGLQVVADRPEGFRQSVRPRYA